MLIGGKLSGDGECCYLAVDEETYREVAGERSWQVEKKIRDQEISQAKKHISASLKDPDMNRFWHAELKRAEARAKLWRLSLADILVAVGAYRQRKFNFEIKPAKGVRKVKK